MLPLIAAIFVLGLLILFHELGHFMAARLSGVKVTVFSIGFGPAVAAVERGGTVYRLAVFPIGGYVRVEGMQRAAEEDREPAGTTLAGKEMIRKAVILMAGPIFNFFLAALIISSIYLVGIPIVSTGTVIGSVKAKMPANLAGIQAGDAVLSINKQDVDDWQGVSAAIAAASGMPLSIAVERDGGRVEFVIFPEVSASGKATIGILPVTRIYREPFLKSILLGLSRACLFTEAAVEDLLALFKMGKKPELAGPVGIAVAAGEQVKKGYVNFAVFSAVVSIFLMLVNLLPIPGLDGGRLLLVLIWAVRGRPVKPAIERILSIAGLTLVILLVAAATMGDILRLLK